MPRMYGAHLDRRRERPLEAGETPTGVHGTFWNGANSCGDGPMLESGRWAVDCAVSHAAAMGYERRRYRGYVNLYRERAERGRKISDSNRPDLEAGAAFYLALRRCTAGCQGG